VLQHINFIYQKIKSLLHLLYTHPGVTSERCSYQQTLRQGPHINISAVASCWQCVGDLSSQDMNPYLPVQK